MPEDRNDLDPLRFQLQTLNEFLNQTERRLWVHEGNVCMPAKVWAALADALADLANCARRSL